MIDKFKGMNVELDLPNQVEFNRRKNVNQDQRLDTLSSQLAELLAQEPAGYLPEVFYGLTAGQQTYRFPADYQFVVDDLEGNEGDSYEIYDEAQSEAYIPAIAVQVDEDKLQVIIKGDYPVSGETFKVVNMRDGSDYEVTLSGALLLQDASYLGALDAEDYKNKQISVLHDLASNLDNVMFCSIDYNNDGNFNWLSIGSFTHGTDGKSIYAVTNATLSTVVSKLKAGDSIVATEAMTPEFGGETYTWNTGDVYQAVTINPYTFYQLGNIRGPQGATGSTGPSGADGEDGETPTITDGYWYIGGVSTGVKAVGTDGTDGTDGSSFQMQSGLYSVPANESQTGNVDPDGNPLQTLPTLPTTGITGKGYVVYDPLTTPLSPYYDLYWANDGDNSWTIIHPFNGVPGQDGTNGLTPFIGANGNWWIGTTDTGTQAQGPAGPAGPSGIETIEGTQSNPILIYETFYNLLPGQFYFLKGYVKGSTNDTSTHSILNGNTNAVDADAKMLVYHISTNRLLLFDSGYDGTNFTIGSSFASGGVCRVITGRTSSPYISGSVAGFALEKIPMPISETPVSTTYNYKVLTTNNTTSYTPTADYHPATKKYVDDNAVVTHLYRHHIQSYAPSASYYLGFWCEIVNTSSTAITTMSQFTTALYNGGYRRSGTGNEPGELLVQGYLKNGSTYNPLLALASEDGTKLTAVALNSLSNSSYSSLFYRTSDSSPVGTISDSVTQIS